MKMTKYIISSLMACFLIGCDDFLEEEQPHLISADIAFTSIETTLPAILGLYEGLAGVNMPSGANYYVMLTNDLMHHFSASPRSMLYTSTEENLSGFYSDRYEIIARANEIIEVLSEFSFDGSDELSAEAKFVRAYLYFDMARLFGGVPLIDQKPASFFDPALLNIPRNTEEDIYAFVISDLEQAIAGLPETPQVAGRPSADAARALLARVQLYRASIEQRDNIGDGREKYQQVVELCDAIIQSGRWSLTPFYHAIFHPKFEGLDNSEVLFKINQAFGDDLADHSYNGISPDNGGQFGGGAGGTFRITWKTFINYSQGDSVRRMKNFLRARYRANSRLLFGGTADHVSNEYLKYLPDNNSYKTNGAPDLAKALRAQTEGVGPFFMTERLTPNKYSNYPLADPNVDGSGTAVDVIVLRLGEVYLMMAEALNEVNNDPSVAGPSGQNAFYYVNQVRRRANAAFDDGGDYVAMNGNSWSEVPGAVTDWAPGDYGVDWFGDPLFTNRVRSSDNNNNFTFWNYANDYEAFRNEIIWERAREMLLEQGTRFHDMVRRGNSAIDEVFMVNNLPGMYVDSNGNPLRYEYGAWDAEEGIERFATINNFKLPIPLEQINNNRLLEQNPGY